MRKLKTLFLLSLCVLAGHLCQAQTKSTSCDVFAPLNEVGPVTEYVSPDKGNCLLKMNHNDEGIQVQIVVKDKATQQRFIMQGFTVYVDLLGKKNKNYAVTFPKANPQMMFDGPKPQPGQSGENDGRQQRVNRPEMSVKPLIASMGLDHTVLTCNEEDYYLDRTKAIIEEADGSVVYAFTVPYDKVGKKLSKKKKVSIGLSCEAPAMSGPANGEGPQGGMPPGGGGGPGGMPPGGGMGGGGGMPPGGGGGRPGGMPSQGQSSTATKAYSQWIVFTL